MNKLNLQSQAGVRTFRELYKTMDNTPPKKAFVQRIAEITMSSETTVRCWIAGAQSPIPLAQNVISKELGIPAEELFPQKSKEKCEQ
jgi:hypothetical protein